jgi:hypothetical protein
MNSKPRDLESQLCELRAATLDASYLERLHASAEGTWTELSASEIDFERQLRQHSPAKLSPEFMAELEKIIGETVFNGHEKIIPFPTPLARPQVRRQRSIWGAAAAVALIGAATALMVPTAKSPIQPIASNPVRAPISAPTPAHPTSQNLVPASFNRNLSKVQNEGIIWKSNNQPHSVVRLTYKDQVTLKDAIGRTIQVDQPRVEYMLVPAKVD